MGRDSLAFCFSALQGLAAAIYIAKEASQWLRTRTSGDRRPFMVRQPILLSVLVLGSLATAGLGIWLAFHPPAGKVPAGPSSQNSTNPSPPLVPAGANPATNPAPLPHETPAKGIAPAEPVVAVAPTAETPIRETYQRASCDISSLSFSRACSVVKTLLALSL